MMYKTLMYMVKNMFMILVILVRTLNYSLTALSIIFFPYIGYTSPDFYMKYVMPMLVVLYISEPLTSFLIDRFIKE